MRKSKNIIISGVVFLCFWLFGQEAAFAEVNDLGKKIYEKRCAVCHGVEGKGDGPAKDFLYPKPRDLTVGKFKIRSTPSGSLPADKDLLKTIRNGIPGTSMPSWRRLLPEKELLAVVQYIKGFDKRFKTSPPRSIANGPPPPMTPQLLAKGKQLYQDAGCYDCHGTSGKGDGPAAKDPKDDWGDPILPYDFTKPGRYKAGSSIHDIYYTFTTGMTGTPMPSYEDSLAEDERWALAYYVQSLSKQPAGPVPKEEATITSRFIKEDLSSPNPASAAWKNAPAIDICLRPLWFKDGYVDCVRVRSLHDGRNIAFLLEWEDPTKNADLQRIEAFSDAVAIQFPTSNDEVPSFPMGEAGQVVNIWQWKAGWEGNSRGTSVENLSATGFSTTTTHALQNLKGRGLWSDGKWRVTFSRALAGGENAAEFAPGKILPIAFAVWDGGAGQRGGKKSVSTWSYLKIEVPIQP